MGNVVPRPPHGLVCLTLPRLSSTTLPPNTGTLLTKTNLVLLTTTNSDTHLPVSLQLMPESSLLVSIVTAMASSMPLNALHGENSFKVIWLNGDGIQVLINKQQCKLPGTTPKTTVITQPPTWSKSLNSSSVHGTFSFNK